MGKINVIGAGLAAHRRQTDTTRSYGKVSVIGAGLAGCEAAWQAAQLGAVVTLYEMKPSERTPAHSSDSFAELVCSNSLRSGDTVTAPGLLKQELRLLHSLIMEAADKTAIPAGGALAVDRTGFSDYITHAVRNHPNITVVEKRLDAVPDDGTCVIATGPLTSGGMADYIASLTGSEGLHFFDAAAPIVEYGSIDMEKAFRASRYGKGSGDDYINCPMDEDEYKAFYDALTTAQTAKLHGFDEEQLKVFEGCMPVEVMASRGFDTLRFGPLKPVGLTHPVTGRQPYAVVQLRQDDAASTLYNLVGFQTHLTFGEQKRVFSMIPGLENALFVRYGVMHRNTYLDSPRLLDCTYAMRSRPGLFFAGQMTGVEGYIESTASGLIAGINAARTAAGQGSFVLPTLTATGALAAYISSPAVVRFEPMNINFGLIDPLGYRVRGGKREKNKAVAERSLSYLEKLTNGDSV
ncbi:MAG: methylenetetrahydrofolate--tRNA-(uracil(54)-C(5))-methyltransferase (FADH(2)-oxidizing) TrmFO [Eubacteriales bacterium]